jgi:hypothetical protein
MIQRKQRVKLELRLQVSCSLQYLFKGAAATVSGLARVASKSLSGKVPEIHPKINRRVDKCEALFAVGVSH